VACQSYSSVVRLIATVLFSLTLLACTAQYTREVSGSALKGVGLGTSVKITRTGTWSLAEGTAVRLIPTSVAGADPHAYPRLSSHLDQLLESVAAEWFHGGGQWVDAEAKGESGVLLHLRLAAVADRLSSAGEIADRSTQSEAIMGRDRLYLVMKVYDLRTGKLLDTMAGEAVSGWRWGEQRVADLAEPTLRLMLARLRGVTDLTE
jgi:hypothetical protein